MLRVAHTAIIMIRLNNKAFWLDRKQMDLEGGLKLRISIRKYHIGQARKLSLTISDRWNRYRHHIRRSIIAIAVFWSEWAMWDLRNRIFTYQWWPTPRRCRLKMMRQHFCFNNVGLRCCILVIGPGPLHCTHSGTLLFTFCFDRCMVNRFYRNSVFMTILFNVSTI